MLGRVGLDKYYLYFMCHRSSPSLRLFLQASMCFKFDTVEQAGGFAKDVLLGADPKDIFKAEKSFMNPRDADNLTKDYSEKCIIL